MSKRNLYFLVIIVVVIGGGFGFIYRDKLDVLVTGEKLLLPPANLDIKTYSLGGKVISAQEDRIVFSAALVYQTLKGNVVGYQNKTAIIDSNTQLLKLTAERTYQAATISDFQQGTAINAYYNSSPLEVDELRAEKVEIGQN